MSVVFSVNNAVLFLFLFVVLRSLVKRSATAGALTFVLAGVLVGSQVVGGAGYVQLAVAIGTLVRFGFLAFVVAGTFDFALRRTPFTVSLGEWYASATVTMLSLLVALVVYGFVRSRGKEPLFGRRLVPE